MGFIERLRQEDAVKALKAEQLKALQKAREESLEREKRSRETTERERHAKRREQAENFRKESGTSLVIDKLAEYLRSTESSIRRGEEVSYSPKDPDSVDDKIKWGFEYHSYSRTYDGYHNFEARSWCDRKSIVVETCPDGTIVFHAGRGAASTIKLKEWRSPKKEQLFERALEKAFRNPGITSEKLYDKQDDYIPGPGN